MEQAWQPSPSTFLDGFAGENDIQIIEGLGSKDSGGGGTDTRGIIRDVIGAGTSVYETERQAKGERDMSRAEREADAARREHELRILEMQEEAAARRAAEAARRASQGGEEEEGLSTTAMVGIGVGVVVLGLGVVMLMRR